MIDKPRLAYFPASFFGMIMGLTGLAIAFINLSSIYSEYVLVANIVFGYAAILFIVLVALYLYKTVVHTQAVIEELKHPIKMNFVPTISISLLLLSIATYVLGYIQVSKWLWASGAILQIALTYWVLYNWIHHEHFKIEHSNPAWFIPIVGNIIVPIAGVHHSSLDINWFFFAVGIVFWLVIKAILLNRIIFHNTLPERLIPTLFIFIAPPAVGFISYLALNDGDLNQFAMVLYFFAVAITLLMIVSLNKFVKLNFALSWWAFTFPLDAMAIASYKMYQANPNTLYLVFGVVINVITLILILWFTYKTINAVLNKRICVDH